jgi:hypothetical protein
MSSADSPSFELKDVVSTLTSLTEVMQKMAIQFGAVEEKVNRIEKKTQALTPEPNSEDNWRDGAEFSPGARPSSASMLSLVTNQDAGTKLERPKFVVKLSKTIDGTKKEFIRDSDFIDYFDEYDHYILSWENLPMNFERRLLYPNKERVALLTLPTKYAQFLCSKLKIAFNSAMMQFKTPRQIRDAVYWQEMTTAEVRLRIGLKFEEEVSDHGAVEILQRIKFNSQFGLIDALAFADYQHEFKKELLRIQSGGQLKVNAINLKDLIISALPDKTYQRQLYTKYGPTGTLILDPADFAIDLIFDEVELRITSVTKQGLRAIVNKATREKEAFQPKQPHIRPALAHAQQAIHVELEEIVEEQVNAAMAGDKKCKRGGIGKDNLLLCRWLGEKGACSFEHTVSEMALKGKGVSKDSQNPGWLNNGKKVFQLIEQDQDEFYDAFQTIETGRGGGADFFEE